MQKNKEQSRKKRARNVQSKREIKSIKYRETETPSERFSIEVLWSKRLLKKSDR